MQRRPLGHWFPALSEPWASLCLWSANEATLAPHSPSRLFVGASPTGFCCNQRVLANAWTLGPVFSFLCICETLILLELQENVLFSLQLRQAGIISFYAMVEERRAWELRNHFFPTTY